MRTRVRKRRRRPSASLRVLISSAIAGVVVALVAAGGSPAATHKTAATAPVSTAPPAILGTAAQGATLAASTGGWSGTTPFVFAYQWQRCKPAGTSCADIGGATNSTYSASAADIDSTLRVVVTASNTAGVVQATSNATASVTATAANAPLNTSPPALSGVVQEGETLAAGSGSWNGATPVAFTYQWERCDLTGSTCSDIGGASAATYTIAAADVAATLRVVVTASNTAGATSAVSAQTAAVASASSPVNTAPPTISGSATLTASPGSWNGPAPITFTYQWERCDAAGGSCAAVAGATAQTYVPGAADAGHTMRVVVTATNSVGAASVVSGPTEVFASASRPANVALPSIAGVTRQGEELTVVKGTWTGSSPIVVTYQWQRCNSQGTDCSAISNAAGTGYRLTLSDVGHTIRVVATASNSLGNLSVTSGHTATISPSAPQSISPPSISGTTRQGSTLAASSGSWASSSSIRFQYQWTRCNSTGGACAPIPGKLGFGMTKYTLTAADVGHRIFVQVKAINAVGSSFVNSATTAVVEQLAGPVPTPPKLPISTTVVPVGSVSLPDRLTVNKLAFSPSKIHSRSAALVARFHVVESDHGKSVSGALVYAVGVPFGWLSNAGETVTDGTGWATITFHPRAAMPLKHGTFVVIFVRARKPGGSLLGGISTRRLVSVRVG